MCYQEKKGRPDTGGQQHSWTYIPKSAYPTMNLSVFRINWNFNLCDVPTLPLPPFCLANSSSLNIHIMCLFGRLSFTQPLFLPTHTDWMSLDHLHMQHTSLFCIANSVSYLFKVYPYIHPWKVNFLERETMHHLS